MCDEDPDLRQLNHAEPLDTDQDGKTKRCLFFGVSFVPAAVAAAFKSAPFKSKW